MEDNYIYLQAFETWSLERIRTFVEPSGMYIGFCFGTLLDVGLFSQNWITGSRNVLLLALTRGFIKLIDNLTNEKIHWDPKFRDELERKECVNNRRPRVIKENVGTTRPEDEPNLKDVTKNRKIVYEEGVYLGSTGRGIVVKIERFPLRLIWVWSLFLLAIGGFPYVYWSGEYDGKDLRGGFRAIGAILELWGALIALSFLIVKTMFKEWSVLDMFHSRKRCKSLEELIQVMRYTEKRDPKKAIGNFFKRFSNKHSVENKTKAISLCATLPYPEKIFAYYNSCAFSVEGQGEFEVDVTINVADLNGADYYFGVNYYGDPIVKDAKGDIRKIHFEIHEGDYSKDDTRSNESIVIGAHHPLQTNKIFHLPTKNRIVGMRKMRRPSFLSRILKTFNRTPRVDSVV